MSARPEPATYGQPRPRLVNDVQWAIWDAVTKKANDLGGRLAELVQIGHRSVHPDDIRAVRGALFKVHSRD